ARPRSLARHPDRRRRGRGGAALAADPPGLADIPGGTASRALTELSHDEDRAVALTASYILGMREAR
ncbi:hypothetical protein ACWD5B_08005, partial [Streptomyces tanashiensis]